MTDPSAVEISRRGFLVVMGGVTLGVFALPGSQNFEPLPAQANPSNIPSERLRALVGVPSKFGVKADGSFSLLYGVDRGNGPETMLWTARTAAEIAEAERFYQAALKLNSASIEPVAHTLVERARQWLGLNRRSAEERQLLEAIHADPLAREPLFAYADWLTSRGDPQGEYIRLRYAYETGPVDDPENDKLRIRGIAIHDAHQQQWVRPLELLGLRPHIDGKLVANYWMRRGVFYWATIDRAGLLPEAAAELFETMPLLDSLCITYPQLDAARIIACPEFSRVRFLAFADGFKLEHVQALADATHLHRLKDLQLFCKLAPIAGEWLGRAPWLGQLKSLQLVNRADGIDPGLADLGFQQLFDTHVDGELQELSLQSHVMTQSGMHALCQSRLCRHLEVLNLDQVSLSAPVVAELRGAVFTSGLKSLRMRNWNQRLDASTFIELASAPLERLTSLDVFDQAGGEAGWQALVQAPWWQQLESLEASGPAMAANGFSALVAARSPALRKLMLSHSQLTDAHVKELAASPLLAGLRELRLFSNDIGPEGTTALVMSPRARNLRQLDLTRNPIGAAGARAILNSPQLRKLQTLKLAVNDIGDPDLWEQLNQRFEVA